MTTRTITFDDEQWQLVPKELTDEMFDRLAGAGRHWSLCEAWDAMLAAAPEPRVCFCDEKGIGDPAKSCGDCPQDYGIPTVRASPEPPAQQPMTDEQMFLVLPPWSQFGVPDGWIREAVRRVERYHGIGKGESNAD